MTPSESHKAYPNIYPQMLMAYVLEHGPEATELLRRTKLGSAQLQQAEGRIAQQDYQQMVANAVNLLDAPDLGLRIGQQINLGAHGYVGYAAMSSPSVGHALRLGAKYYAIQGRPTRVDFVEEHGEAGFNFELDLVGEAPAFYRYVMEIAVATTLSALRFYFQALPDLQIELSYPAPDYAKRYRELLGLDVQFGQVGNRLRFPATHLEHPLASANPALAKMAEQHCQALLAAQSERHAELPAQIEQALLRQAGHFPSQDQIAEQLHMSPRNLRLQLQKQGSSYQTILSQVRKDLSLHYLQQDGMTVDDIAYLLDYKDTASFTRAFRKWTGKSPSQMRG